VIAREGISKGPTNLTYFNRSEKKEDGTITDVAIGGPAQRAVSRLGPNLMAVNKRQFTPLGYAKPSRKPRPAEHWSCSSNRRYLRDTSNRLREARSVIRTWSVIRHAGSSSRRFIAPMAKQ